MSVDHDLLRVTSFSEDYESLSNPIPFGNQSEIIERLCSVVGFKAIGSEQADDRVILLYQYHHECDQGRVVEFCLQGNPVMFISINRAEPEDFYPIMDVLSDLAPFAILENGDTVLNPEQLYHSFEDWMQLNYEEAEL